MASKPSFLQLDDLERLMVVLDAGVYDDQFELPAHGEPTPASSAPLQRFAEVKPFDVKAWAERKGIKLPEV